MGASGANLGTAYLSIVPSMGGFEKALSGQLQAPMASAGHAGGSKFGGGFAAGFGKVAKTTAKVVAGGLAAGVAGVGAVMGVSISRGLTRALDIQDAQAKLRGMGKSAEEIAGKDGKGGIMGSVYAAVRGTAFGLGDGATIAASAVAAGIKPGQELTKYLQLTADAAARAQVPLGDMGNILNQTTTTGKVYTDTLNQLASRGIPVFQDLAKYYGVSQDALSKMATKGMISAADLRAALTKDVGGAAKQSGETARGAWANVGAAFGRLGVQLGAGAAVAKAPKLFTALSNAVDNTGGAIKPLTDLISGALGSAMTSLTNWINHIDFVRVAAGVKVFTANLKAFIGGMTSATGVAKGGGPLAGFAAAGARVRSVFTGVLGFVRGAAKGIGAAFAGIGSAASGGGGKSPFDAIGHSVTILKPAIGQLIGVLPKVAPALATVASSGATILAKVLGFLADHIDTIVALIPAFVAGLLLWKAATNGTLAASKLLAATQLAALPVTTANNIMNLATARTNLALARANGTLTGSTLGSTLATARNIVVTVAQRVALFAAAAAQKAAAAAQWLLNAAMDANPIGIVVLAIAALVAGLIWFFTQTKLGQQIWAGFVAFLQQAWAAIAAVIGATLTAIGAVLTAGWNAAVGIVTGVMGTIGAAIAAGWNATVGFITGVLGTIRNVIAAGWSVVVGVVTAAVNGVRAVIAFVFGLITAYIRLVIGIYATIFRVGWAVITTVVGAAINGVRAVVTTVFNFIVGFIRNYIATWIAIFRTGFAIVRTVVSTVVNAIRGVVTRVFNFVVAFVRAYIATWIAIFRTGFAIVRGVVSTVLGVIRGVVSAAIGFVTGVFRGAVALITGAVHRAFDGALGIARGILGTLRTIVSRGVAGVVGFFTGMGARITGAVKNAGSILAGIGKHIVDGLVNGIKGAWHFVTDAVKGLADLIPKPIRDALGIHSPSRVMEQIGLYIGAGLQRGLKGSAGAVSSAMDTLIGKVSAGYDKLDTERKAAEKRYAGIYKRLNNLKPPTPPKPKASARASAKSTTDSVASIYGTHLTKAGLAAIQRGTKAATKAATPKPTKAPSMAAYNRAMAAYKRNRADLLQQLNLTATEVGGATAALNRLVPKSVLIAFLKREGAQLEAVAKERDRIAGKLKTAQGKLADAMKARSDYAASVAGGIIGQGNVTSLDSGVRIAGSTILAHIRGVIANAAKFKGYMATLRREGLNPTMQDQLVQAFQQSGDPAFAAALVKSGAGIVGKLNGAQTQLSGLGKGIGAAASHTMYDAGVNTAQGLVNGLKSQEKALAREATHLGHIITGATKASLGIHSPSRVYHAIGTNVTQGFANGITDSARVATRALGSLTDTSRLNYAFDAHTAALSKLSAARPVASAGTVREDHLTINANGYSADEVADRIEARRRRREVMLGGI